MKKTIPAALRIIAYLCILIGLSSLVGMVNSFRANHIKIDLSVVELFIGIGLLKGKKAWRSFALMLTRITFIAVPLICILLLGRYSTWKFKLFGKVIYPAPTELVIIFGVLVIAYHIWQYSVLNRKEVLTYFDIKD